MRALVLCWVPNATQSSPIQGWGAHSTRRLHRQLFRCLNLAFTKLPCANASAEVTVYVSERWNSWGQVWKGDIIGGEERKVEQGGKVKAAFEKLRQIYNGIQKEMCRLTDGWSASGPCDTKTIAQIFFLRERNNIKSDAAAAIRWIIKKKTTIRVYTFLESCRKEKVVSIVLFTYRFWHRILLTEQTILEWPLEFYLWQALAVPQSFKSLGMNTQQK